MSLDILSISSITNTGLEVPALFIPSIIFPGAEPM